MEIGEFDTILDTAELDPRERWKRRTRELLAVELRGKGLSADAVADVTRPALRDLGNSLVSIIERRSSADPNAVFAKFHGTIREAIAAAGKRTKPATQRDQLQRHAILLEKYAYSALELESLVMALRPEETIIRVGVREVVTSARTIARLALAKVLRPLTVTPNRWRAQFATEETLAMIEADLAGESQERPPWAGNRNADIR